MSLASWGLIENMNYEEININHIVNGLTEPWHREAQQWSGKPGLLNMSDRRALEPNQLKVKLELALDNSLNLCEMG